MPLASIAAEDTFKGSSIGAMALSIMTFIITTFTIIIISEMIFHLKSQM